MDLFSFCDYRALLKDCLLERKKQFPTAYTFQEMATRCRVHKAYLSKVLAGNGHLSGDQLFEACEYLGLRALESRFVEVLSEWQRSVSKERRKQLARALAAMRDEGQATEAHIETEAPARRDTDSEYYLDLNFQIVHMLLTIERYARDATQIAAVLKLPDAEIARIVHRLSQLGIVSLQDGVYVVVRDLLHLPQADGIFPAHNRLLRLRSLERLAQAQDPKPYSFSATVSADLVAFEAIRKDFLALVKRAQEVVAKAPQTSVFQLNFDLFTWDG